MTQGSNNYHRDMVSSSLLTLLFSTFSSSEGQVGSQCSSPVPPQISDQRRRQCGALPPTPTVLAKVSLHSVGSDMAVGPPPSHTPWRGMGGPHWPGCSLMSTSGSGSGVTSECSTLKIKKWGFPTGKSGYNYQRTGERILDNKEQHIATTNFLPKRSLLLLNPSG